MIKTILPVLIITLSIFANGRVCAQSEIDSTGLNHVIANYNTAIDQQSHLYNGPEYEFYDPLIKGNAYVFDVKTFSTGNVNYNGTLYNNIPMMYDINKDVIVILLYNHFTKISLLSTRIPEFWLLNHHFVRINSDSTGRAALTTGFYDQLYAGQNTQVLVRREKSIQTATGSNTVETFFRETKNYYVKKGPSYLSFSSKGALLDIFRDKKKELRQYIKTNNIDFRENFEQAITNVASYYDHLTN
ncbi:hypothetical protein [Mucilaginibacter endophyticus]|uniref:hypothetical protein n=1 Tax=Mucilaginibacter endophyticus TaxID=2675003 RepID=UPI000E0DFB52|nr:hypothetical protein [Mucilaginibacter endophyticus]